MLVLNRKVGERIFVGQDIEIVVTRISPTRVSLGIRAPQNMKILREELEPFSSEALLPGPTEVLPTPAFQAWK